MDLKDKKVVFLGDSITEGACVTRTEYTYHSILAQKFAFKESINLGVSGTRIARQVEPNYQFQNDRDYIYRYSDIDKQCDVLVIFGGTNDFGHGDAPIGNINDRTEHTFYGALHILLQKAIMDFGKDNVIVLTPLHRTDENNLRGDGSKKLDGAPLNVYVNAIREVTSIYEVKVVDLYAEDVLNPNVGDHDKYFADGLHPNNEGHALLAEILYQKIIAF